MGHALITSFPGGGEASLLRRQSAMRLSECAATQSLLRDWLFDAEIFLALVNRLR